ncbi:MAG: hypothetical protein JO013_12845, partial [Alphaproteobacteria bacterium]|nr:hypothetical protein [Alphaproteobacteria bacterium]
RTGFPTARAVVIDNGSRPELRAAIFAAAAAAGCETRAPRRPLPHGRLVARLIAASERPCVFVDPDVAFWERVEHWDFAPHLLAGRFIPAVDVGGLKMTPRLHTSHLWVTDPPALRARIAAIRRRHPACGDLFEQRREPATRLYWDTASALCMALGTAATAFGEAQLDAYDHVFAGSHLERALPAGTDPAVLARLRDWHARAQADPRALRGVWREQEAVMRACAWREAEPDPALAWMRREPSPGRARRLLRAARRALG